jgi:hypothetical protein
MNNIPKAYETLFLNGIKHPYLYLWDAWSYCEDETLHLYCLAVPRFLSDGSELDPNERNNFPFHIRHFSSKDNGNSWKDEGCFLSTDEVSKLDFKTIWSGSVKPISDGRKLVAFTGIRSIDSNRNYHQNIALGISNDGYSVQNNSKITLSSPSKDWDEIVDKGYYFDGSSNYISASDSSSLDITSNLTISFWSNLSYQNGMILIGKYDSTGSQRAYSVNMNSAQCGANKLQFTLCSKYTMQSCN